MSDSWLDGGRYMTPNKIVMHHTTVHSDSSVNHTHKNKSKWESLSDLWSFIYYHITINQDGTYTQHRKLEERSRATRENNRSIHIALHGNFDIEKPTTKQLATAKKLIMAIRDKYGDLKVYEHHELDGEHSSCAGKNFSTNMLRLSEPMEQPPRRVDERRNDYKKEDLLWEFKLTYYYAPEDPTKQSEYEPRHTIPWDARWTYERSKKVNCSGDCMQPSLWWPYTEADVGKVVACDRKYDRYQLYVEWYWVVTCRDRWSMIVWKRLDLRAGKWQEWWNNIKNNTLWKPQTANVYIYKKP